MARDSYEAGLKIRRKMLGGPWCRAKGPGLSGEARLSASTPRHLPQLAIPGRVMHSDRPCQCGQWEVRGQNDKHQAICIVRYAWQSTSEDPSRLCLLCIVSKQTRGIVFSL